MEGGVESFEYHGTSMPTSNLHQHAEFIKRSYCFLALFENVNKGLSSKNYYSYNVTFLNSIRFQGKKKSYNTSRVISNRL